MGDAKLGRLYNGIYGLPVTLLIDKQGIVRSRHRGAEDLSKLKSEIVELSKR